MPSGIQNVLLDVGVVLLHIQYERAIRKALPLCDPAKVGGIQQFLAISGRDPIIARYERGDVSAQDFFRHFAAKTGFSGTFEQFADLWCDILSENGPMIEFARELAKTHGVYLVTNAGVIHIPRIYELFPAIRFYRDEAASCFLGAVKPEREFYERAMAKFGVTADTCLLVDDRPENVEGARAVGMAAILYTNAPETIAAIRKRLGLQGPDQ